MRQTLRLFLVCAVSGFAALTPDLAAAQGARPVGGEFIINTTTAGDQLRPEVAMRGDRQFIVVWYGPVSGQGLDIRGRTFNWDGTPGGSEFAVNSATANDQDDPRIALDSMGAFTVVWVDRDTGGAGGDIRARTFDAGDTPMAPDVLVRDTGPGTSLLRAGSPSVTAAGNGRFAVAWKEMEPRLVQGRIMDVAGGSLGPVFEVGDVDNPYGFEGVTAGGTDLASVAAGDFVVVYDDPYYCSCSSYGGNLGRAYRRAFDAAGQPTSPLESVPYPVAYPFVNPLTPQVEADEEGRFVIAWRDDLGYYNSTMSIRTFDADGTPTPNQPWGLQIDEDGDYYGGAFKWDSPPDLDVSPHGDFVVVWGSRYPTGGTYGYDVMARAFDRTATPRGEKMVVNTTLTSTQTNPAIAMDGDGQLVVAWQSSGQDGDGTGIVGRRFCLDVPLALLATGPVPPRLRVVDLESGAVRSELMLSGDERLVEGVPPVTSRHGRRAALLTSRPGAGSRLRVVEIGSGIEERVVDLDGAQPVAGIPPLFTRDGARILVAASDAASMTSRLWLVERSTGTVMADMTFSPGESLAPWVGMTLLDGGATVALVTADAAGGAHVRFVDAATGLVLSQAGLSNSEVLVRNVSPVATPAGDRLLVATSDLVLGTARFRVFEAATGVEEAVFDLGSSQRWVPGVGLVVSGDGSQLVALTGGAPSMLHVVDLVGLTAAAPVLLGADEFPVEDVGLVLTADGATAAAATNDVVAGSVHLRLLDTASATVSADLVLGAADTLVPGVAPVLTPNEKWVVAATQAAVPRFHLVDVAAGTLDTSLELGPPPGESLSPRVGLSVTPESNRVVMATTATGGDHVRVISIPAVSVLDDAVVGSSLNLEEGAGPQLTPCGFTALVAAESGGGAPRLRLLDVPTLTVAADLDMNAGESVLDGVGVVVPPSVVRADCNDNFINDATDITRATSADCNGNGLPDECEADCNGNGAPDDCDISGGFSMDCDLDGTPDECQPDCNANGVADVCDIADTTSADCSGNGIPDECEPDCNDNATPDSCDIFSGPSLDCQGDGVPDECQGDLDPDGDGVSDCSDNCPQLVNPDQADTDGDGVGDACDADDDDDGVMDALDNCALAMNADQANSDADGAGDACDCVTGDAAVWAAPAEARSLMVGLGGSGEALLTWAPPATAGGLALSYDALQASQPGGFANGTACLEAGDSDTLAVDPAPLLTPWTARFYLVRAISSCPSGDGPVGAGTDGNPRSASACP